jgi:hypothetical protein
MGSHGSSGLYTSYRKTLQLPLHGFREATSGDVSNIAANGGILASDTTPVMSGTASTVSQQLSWAASNVDQILCQLPLPEEFDGREDVLIELWVNSGTTDAASFSVLTNWDGAAADITDTATGSASATTHKTTARISAADIPDSPSFVSVALVPATHGTNAIVLVNARMTYVPKTTS